MPDNTQDKQSEIADEVLIPEELADFGALEEMEEFGEVLPTMSVEPVPLQEDKDCIVQDEVLLGLYDEIINNCRTDREKVDKIQSNFEDMVINDGDASSASKEALVSLMKIKTDINDKMSKVADFMTRIKLKDNNTFKPYLTVNNPAMDNKRAILKAIEEKRRAKGG